MNRLLFYIFITLTFCSFAQEKEYNTANVTVNRFVEGTLVTPYADDEVPLIIFIMDSGEINRDGNDRMSRNDVFSKLSVALAKKGIATFRYDKRLLKIDILGIKPGEMKIEDFVTDARSVISYFQKKAGYTKIYVVGHGQGSLVGMLAIDIIENEYGSDPVEGFISLAGNAQSVDRILVQQLEKQSPGLDENAARAFAELKIKGQTNNYDPVLEPVFGLNVQTFMKSWIAYTPSEVIANLDLPILILQGDKDIQVEVSEAEQLKAAAPDAELIIVKNMNHVLREIKGGRLENHKSYNEYWLPIIPEVIASITTFVGRN